MAVSPAHRFGQIIGDVLEAAIQPLLAKFAHEHGLYLDQKGPRPCRAGKKCKWIDSNGNAHDLDFVLERAGTTTKVGVPAAFIETAWRRYTKHSRNKAQEIQGAIEPLAATYHTAGPFKGAILAGVFTSGALTQLKSLGFTVLYFPYEKVVKTFQRFGIDASSEENTSLEELQAKIDAYNRLSLKQKEQLTKALIQSNQSDVDFFMSSLSDTINRQIERIIILALHGELHEVATVDDAIDFIAAYNDYSQGKPVERFEVQLRYNNGNEIRGSFKDKNGAIEFLTTYQPTPPQVA